MENIQVIDGAENALFSIFRATEEEFAVLLPDGKDIAFAENFDDLDEATRSRVFTALHARPADKKPSSAYMEHCLSGSQSGGVIFRRDSKLKRSSIDLSAPHKPPGCQATRAEIQDRLFPGARRH